LTTNRGFIHFVEPSTEDPNQGEGGGGGGKSKSLRRGKNGVALKDHRHRGGTSARPGGKEGKSQRQKKEESADKKEQPSIKKKKKTGCMVTLTQKGEEKKKIKAGVSGSTKPCNFRMRGRWVGEKTQRGKDLSKTHKLEVTPQKEFTKEKGRKVKGSQFERKTDGRDYVLVSRHVRSI